MAVPYREVSVLVVTCGAGQAARPPGRRAPVPRRACAADPRVRAGATVPAAALPGRCAAGPASPRAGPRAGTPAGARLLGVPARPSMPGATGPRPLPGQSLCTPQPRPVWRTGSCTTRFDAWLARNYRGVQFERYADDAVVHCVTERQAREVPEAIGKRMEQVGLRLHPAKTRIRCSARRRPAWLARAHVFHVPGFTFRARAARGQEREEVHLVPARGEQGCPAQDECGGPVLAAAPAYVAQHRRLRPRDNPVVRGWMQYYGAFYCSALLPLLRRINAYLMRPAAAADRRRRSPCRLSWCAVRRC
jgi:Reverse transcriptase (RNA-dependent DNA polymerase)/Group II intron, maturase-specific domain